MAGRSFVNDWVGMIRRARIGRTTKLVALMMATHADPDGTRVHPGIARLALTCELSYNIVKASLGDLRTAGLVQLVSQATGRHQADEYRLVLPGEPDKPAEIWSDERLRDEIESMLEQRRGKHRKPPTAVGRAAVPAPEPQPTARAAASVSARPTRRAPQEAPAAHAPGSAPTDLQPVSASPAAHGVGDLQPAPLPPTHHYPPLSPSIALPEPLRTIVDSLTQTDPDATPDEGRAVLRLIAERHHPRSTRYYTKIAGESGFAGYLAEVRAAAAEERAVAAAKRHAELAQFPACPHGDPGGLEPNSAGKPRCPMCRRGLPAAAPHHPPMPADQRAVADAYRVALLASGPPPLDLFMRVATVANQAKEYLARGAAPEALTPYAEIAGRTGTDLTTAIRHGSPA